MNLRIADITLAIEGLGGQFGRDLADRYAAFVCPGDGVADMTVQALADPTMPGVELGESEDHVIAVEHVDGDADIYRIDRRDNPFHATVDMRRGSSTVRLAPNVYCFDSFLRVLFSLMLARRGGALLHAASLKIGDSALIAVGQSGAGKSTLARQGFDTILSDELVAVTRGEGAGDFIAHGTPFWGEFAAGTTQDAAPVKEVYLLRQGAFDGVTATAKTPALLELLGCTFFFGPETSLPAVLDLCADLLDSLVVGELHFRPTPAVADYLKGRVCDVVG